MNQRDVLQSATFGQWVAENEANELTRYFVETDAWKRLLDGQVDVIYGDKGAGKSALYALLLSRRDELFDRLILLAVAENPRGAPAFKDLIADPPATEAEFIGLWKLYFLSILVDSFSEYGVGGEKAGSLRDILKQEGLLREGRSLSGLLQTVVRYVRAMVHPEGIELGVEIDPTSGKQTLKGRITFRVSCSPLS